MIVSSFCLNDWDEEIMTPFLQLWNLRKKCSGMHTTNGKDSERIQLQWKWVIGCIRGFLRHKKFHLRREIEISPPVHHIHCLNSSLFSSDAEWAECVWQKNRFFTVSLLYHFKDCRGVLICKDTGLKRRRRKKPHGSCSAHTFPHLYWKSELLEVKCGGNV